MAKIIHTEFRRTKTDGNSKLRTRKVKANGRIKRRRKSRC